MKILIVSSWYPPILSGSSLWAESLVVALRKRGHNVRVVTTCWKGLREDSSRDQMVYELPAHLLPKNRFLLGLSIVPVAYTPSNKRKILDIVKEFKPDVIHQINHIHDTVFLTAYAARKTGTPLIGSITTPIQSSSPVINAMMHMVDSGFVYKFGVRYWNRIICSDSTQAQYVYDNYGQRAKNRVVTNIFVGVHECIQKGRAVVRADYPQIVSVGHIHPMRDPTNLIRAMPLVLKHFPNARLDIAGRVQFNQPINEVNRLHLTDSVSFLGEVRKEQVSELVSKAIIFAILHQCRYAGLSFTAIEAMQFGTPVVINAPDNLYGSGIIKDGENIIIVNRDNIKEIAEKIICLINDDVLRQRIGLNGKNFVSKYLNWDLCAEKTEELYSCLLY